MRDSCRLIRKKKMSRAKLGSTVSEMPGILYFTFKSPRGAVKILLRVVVRDGGIGLLFNNNFISYSFYSPLDYVPYIYTSHTS